MCIGLQVDLGVAVSQHHVVLLHITATVLAPYTVGLCFSLASDIFTRALSSMSVSLLGPSVRKLFFVLFGREGVKHYYSVLTLLLRLSKLNIN